ncbi:hypothetical protein [Gilvibacter sp.]|uniref:hypothetical protein n=1 Tax=Gilvibacter sp. TaxID=2729997 RepID=UPI0025C1372C|nr:hypothetical protein [Gilvibacter sp.]NQX77812.1 hypothetical protein [Gilvibacter sp.]
MEKTNNKTNTAAALLKRWAPVVVMLSFLAVEFYSKFLRYSAASSDLQKGFKGIVLIAMLLGLLLNFKFNKRLILLLGALFGVFLAGQFTLDPAFSYSNWLTLGRFVLPIVFFGFFASYPSDKDGLHSFFNLFEWFFVLNLLFVLVGMAADWYVVHTYMGDRFGYNGFLVTSATASYAFFAALGYYYFRYGIAALRQWRFWIVVVGSALAGTKSLYLGMVLFGLLMLFDHYKKYWKFLLPAGALCLLGALYILLYQVPEFAQIRVQEGFWSALLSYRDQLLVNQTLPYVTDNWQWSNYLFGGVSDFSLRSQLDLIDLFFFWGIFGGLIYLFTYLKTYFDFKLTWPQLVYFLILGLMVLFAGNFFIYTSVPLFLLSLKLAIVKNYIS